MFEKEKYNSNNIEYWIKVVDTNATVIITFIPDNKLLNLMVFNKNSIYQKDFYIFEVKSTELYFEGVLSLDGNEYDLFVYENNSKEKLLQKFIFYYSLDSNLVISIVEENKRREIMVIPNQLLN